MSDYVPSIGVARARYCDSIVRKDGVPHSFVVTPEEHAKNHAEFDRMIAVVERAAAEKALTEFADEEDAESKQILENMPGLCVGASQARWAAQDESYERKRAATRLRARAEAYRRERGEQ